MGKSDFTHHRRRIVSCAKSSRCATEPVSKYSADARETTVARAKGPVSEATAPLWAASPDAQPRFAVTRWAWHERSCGSQPVSMWITAHSVTRIPAGLTTAKRSRSKTYHPRNWIETANAINNATVAPKEINVAGQSTTVPRFPRALDKMEKAGAS